VLAYEMHLVAGICNLFLYDTYWKTNWNNAIKWLLSTNNANSSKSKSSWQAAKLGITYLSEMKQESSETKLGKII